MDAVRDAGLAQAGIVPGVFVRVSEVSANGDDGFDVWYQRRQLLAPLAIDGFRSARRYRVAGGEPTFMTVYECSSIDVLASAESRAALGRSGAAAPADPGSRIRDTMQLACRETWSVGEGMGGSTIVVQCKPLQGREASARDFIRDTFGPARTPALVRMALWEVDNTLGDVYATSVPVAPARKRKALSKTPPIPAAETAVAGPLWVLSLESYDINRMALAVHECLLGCESGKTGLLVGSWARYQLISATPGVEAGLWTS